MATVIIKPVQITTHRKGKISDVGEAGVTIRYKKPRSSKYIVETIPWPRIELVEQYDSEEFQDIVSVREADVLMESAGEVVESEIAGFTKIELEDGGFIYAPSLNTEISEEEAEGGKKKKKNKDRDEDGGKKKKKKKIKKAKDDDDFDE
jgi:hypothetical protein